MYEENNVIRDLEGGRSNFFTGVFTWMFIGILITAVTAFVVANTSLGSLFLVNPILMFAFFIAEFILVAYISKNVGVENVSAKRTKIAFIVYSIVNGVTISSILLIYAASLVYKAFISSALMFGAMAIYGKYTKADLSKMGSILMMGLIGVIITTLINWIFSFFGMFSGTLDVALGYITLVIFLGLTAWDMQKLKAMAEYSQNNGGEEMTQSLAVYGALSLYLDFINLFLSLIRISRSRD